MQENYKFIHLLYVPTMNCNMQCKYCYLKENAIDLEQDDMYLSTLEYAISKFREANVIPFNISLHGGEVTTLSPIDFKNIVKYIYDYYNKNRDIIVSNGFTVGSPHIKTNLLNLAKHIDTIREFNVSISGSLDLPFSLHDEYRVTKGNQKTLDKILKSIKLLEDLPNKKKVSSTIFKEHYNRLDEMINDIKFLEKNTCLNMNNFNFMIGFTTDNDKLLSALTEEEQVLFYQRMNQEFSNTTLDYGVKNTWFAEFDPTYCSSCVNCGEKFFLLERNGDIYSCVRGQKNDDFYYGNIYTDTVEQIMDNAINKIFNIHNLQGFNNECAECKYLYICNTGCPYVKKNYNINKSYTCKLQQEIYINNNDKYPKDEFNNKNVYEYISKNHPFLTREYVPEKDLILENDIPFLRNIINDDPKLKNIYDNNVFILKVDDSIYKLESQILKNTRDIIFLHNQSKVFLYIKKVY